MTVNETLLPALLAVPLAGSLVMLLLPPRLADDLAAWVGVAASGVTALLAVWVVVAEPTTDVSWVPSLGLRFHLGVDGISSPLVLLTAGLTFLCAVYTLKIRPEAGRTRGLVGLVLLLEVGMLGTFVALDLLLFFVF
ncbi:MAG: NADH-quinone oxidoreductase subunit M, partial [Actinomycetes bacterium]